MMLYLWTKMDIVQESETGFFIKTEGLNPEQQGVLYKAATTDRAILENVKVYDDGKVDFDDVSLTSNWQRYNIKK